ncbi:molybdopterin-guanine dinucleotide biosynthesis protein B [Tropicimonas isoalkanivorans]|uniref:Molybdopterin guanine dinucleotide biosynthesis accessory protein MobB n=1 Tax=Tropicimonas isoalkanivorans TaxID=441112 RepID=A0A1I1DBH8_9RHOB|nr:molybdopterin-guanine dinucleotide biosynthesis protein B [Tropicimonas isoalkanivorans]SFB72315.1 molybdopterin guanine dinucleotide biosynthesis accessory protein MobB [Tropicimonas isoalkanivorans]
MKLYGITGWKNSGKTGLVERIVTEICSRGHSVSTIKHAHHDADVDQPGRDSHRHRQAGAREVLLATPHRWALMHELRGAAEPPLPDLLAQMSPVDLILIEGCKTEPHPKIEAFRQANGRVPLAGQNATIRAVASDCAMPDVAVPIFDLNDTTAIADFILREVGL